MLCYLPPPLPRELGCLRDKRHRKRWNPEQAEKRTDWPCVLLLFLFLWSHRISLRALFAKPMVGKARAGSLQGNSRSHRTADTLVPSGLAQRPSSKLAVFSPPVAAVTPLLFRWSAYTRWRRKRQRTPVLLSGEAHGRRSLVGDSPPGRKEPDTTERLHFHLRIQHGAARRQASASRHACAVL